MRMYASTCVRVLRASVPGECLARANQYGLNLLPA